MFHVSLYLKMKIKNRKTKHEHEHEQLVTQHEVMQAKLCGSTCKPRKYSTCMYDNDAYDFFYCVLYQPELSSVLGPQKTGPTKNSLALQHWLQQTG